MSSRAASAVLALLGYAWGCAEAPTEEALFDGVAAVLELPGVAAYALVEQCTIQVGSGGTTRVYSASLDAGETRSWTGLPASDFIRSTSGPCHFEIFNGSDLSGRSVVLGSGLTSRIRAGVDGVVRKDLEGGDTWRIRSLTMHRRSSACRLRIGGNGVRMDYFADYVTPLPAMDRIDHLIGGDCAAQIYAAPDFGAGDPHNRFKYLHPSAEDIGYEPGFRVRSLALWDNGNDCAESARDHGRCLPQSTLSASLFVDASGTDRDRDGLDDARENELAEAFRPVYFNDSGEDATRVDLYTDAEGRAVMEPATIFQVSPADARTVRIQFMRLWLNDVSDSFTCPGHAGDSQRNSLHLSTSEPGAADHGLSWTLTSTGAGIQDDLHWERGDGSLRGPHFVRLSDESGPGRHIAIYFSRGKHHEYADGGWSGQADKDCFLDVAYVNGRGHLHDPAYPMRAADLKAPPSHGDAFDASNVGSSAAPFFDDLAAFGFEGECVWSCGDFYDANSAGRGFD